MNCDMTDVYGGVLPPILGELEVVSLGVEFQSCSDRCAVDPGEGLLISG